MPNSPLKVAILNDGSHNVQRLLEMLPDTEGYALVGIIPSDKAIVSFMHRNQVDLLVTDTQKFIEHITIIPIYYTDTDLLTPREKAIIELLNTGMLYKEIAQRSGITVGTLKQYVHIIYEKLGVSNRTEAINRYFYKHSVVT